MWTDERVERLILLNSQGLSCSEIAAEIGGISRNAVIGKLHRLGVMAANGGRVLRTAEEARERRLELQRHRRQRATTKKPRIQSIIAKLKIDPETVSQFQAEAVDLTADQRAQSVRFFDLKEGQHCKWPYGDPKEPDFCFCGHTPVEGQPYCETHMAIASAKGDTFKPLGDVTAGILAKLRRSA